MSGEFQAKRERTALPLASRLGPDAPAMGFDELPRNRQPEDVFNQNYHDTQYEQNINLRKLPFSARQF